MARIIENNEGRRMIRLTPDDVLTVVSLYQQHLYDLQSKVDQPPAKYTDVHNHLGKIQFYLPEDM